MLLIQRLDLPFQVIVFDIDDTLYRSREYKESGTRRELEALAEELKLPGWEEADTRLETVGAEMTATGKQLHRPRRYEIVAQLGVDPIRWHDIRSKAWDVSLLRPNPALIDALETTKEAGFKLIAASNGPGDLARRIIEQIGLAEQMDEVWGYDDLGHVKPDKQFFQAVIRMLGVESGPCVSIGNDEETDIKPALAAGYGAAIHVKALEELTSDLENLWHINHVPMFM